jgi:hypothetical protein
MDTTKLHDSYGAFLDAAATVASADAETLVPPPGEWNADQILAHISLISSATVAAVASVGAGTVATYDNRLAHDPWTIERVIALADGPAGLRERIRRQGEALCALGDSALSEAELDTVFPTLLLSNGKLRFDQAVALRDIFTGVTDMELPGHTQQLLALLPSRPPARAD